MKKQLILTAIMALTMLFKMNAQTTNWGIDMAHSSITFTVTHMAISEVEGKFKKFDGTVTSSTPDFTDATATFTIDVSSISTENDMRDGHLKTDDFFNAEKYPQIKFVSTSFKKIDAKNYIIEGNLTIRDVTKKVTFKAVYGGTVKDYKGNNKAGFKATTSINRNDFGITGGKAGVTVSDNVDISVRLELAQK